MAGAHGSAGYVSVSRGEDGYEDARRAALWNARLPDRHPDVIAAPSDEAGVVEAVRAARAAGLRIAVKSGGHSWPGAPLRDGGMLIDLRRLSAFSIDQEAGRIATQPAVTVRDLAAALADAGLGFPTGACPSVCVGGYLLAGGWGWNSKGWGPACHRVEAIDVVTADGELLRADAERHADLLWAARGAGPGFPGVVTRFHLRAFPAPLLATTEYSFEARHIGEVVGWLAEHGDELPPCLQEAMKLAWPAGGGDAPVLSLAALAFARSREEAADALDWLDATPIARLADSKVRHLDSSFAELYCATESGYPEGRRYAADTLWSDRDPVAIVTRLARLLAQAPSRASFLTVVFHRGGLPAAPPPGATLSMRGRLFVGCYGLWERELDDEANLAWVERLMRAMEPDAVGHYVGEMDLRRWHASRAYAPEQWRRLRELRTRVDPDGRFHDYLEPAEAP